MIPIVINLLAGRAGSGGGGGPSAPVNIVAPVIAGTTPVGSILTSTNGTWAGNPSPTYTYQWRRNGVDIGGATNNTYTTQAADVGTAITCRVTAMNSEGSAASTSNSVTVTAAPVNTVVPAISGNTPVGSLLTSTTGTWTGYPTPTYTYQWKRDAVSIAGATNSTYTSQSADISTGVTCTVTGTNSDGSVEATSNSITVTNALAAPVNTIAPVITGNAVVGSTLTSDTGTWTGNPTPTYAYQWRRDAVDIAAATNSTYVSQAADVGTAVTCRVTATNSQGNAGSTSNSITVTSLPVNTVAPVASGSAPVGSLLSCTTGTWTGSPTPTYTYQWQRNTVDISGATASTYTTQAADGSTTVRCRVTGTNTAGNVGANSNGIAVDAALTAPVNTVAPVASGTTPVGSTLSCTTGTWTGNPTPTYTYQWRRDAVDIGGATNSTYVSQAADVATSVTCRVTGTNSQGNAGANSNGITVTAASFSPADLFAAGEKGLWYDPSDLSTLFQDSAGTTPVTADGQTVGKILDKSGRGNHATQATTSKQPLYKTDGTKHWLQFDGVDDCLVTGNIDLSVTDELTCLAGLRRLSDSVTGIVAELSTNASSNYRTFALTSPATSTSSRYYWYAGGSGVSGKTVNYTGGASQPSSDVITTMSDISADSLTLRVDGVERSTNSADLGTNNFASTFPLYIGQRGAISTPFSGYIYSLIIRGLTTAIGTIQDAETWVNTKTGGY